MNSTMQVLDWVIVAGCVALLTAFSLRTVRYMRGVADFLAANRSAGRYMLTLAGGMSGFGAISAVAVFE
jgi:SSS family solute:Na+ symporter